MNHGALRARLTLLNNIVDTLGREKPHPSYIWAEASNEEVQEEIKNFEDKLGGALLRCVVALGGKVDGN